MKFCLSHSLPTAYMVLCFPALLLVWLCQGVFGVPLITSLHVVCCCQQVAWMSLPAWLLEGLWVDVLASPNIWGSHASTLRKHVSLNCVYLWPTLAKQAYSSLSVPMVSCLMSHVSRCIGVGWFDCCQSLSCPCLMECFDPPATEMTLMFYCFHFFRCFFWFVVMWFLLPAPAMISWLCQPCLPAFLANPPGASWDGAWCILCSLGECVCQHEEVVGGLLYTAPLSSPLQDGQKVKYNNQPGVYAAAK